MYKYRVVKQGEDGYYTLEDNLTEGQAYKKADKEARDCGEGQSIYVERYNANEAYCY